MENPEEVLQALDEFQKMRPTEIPRELEDYLCWVAKTGDPVYQWSLIKALFREKLARVMTDFYESCPSFELTPCQNVEHFNYDTMKISLLERLESFANAPFTVQRICELLTAPRKEYNRVDKFMRAIEKNILVVSTKEPGQTTRRSENGDSMVNGSIEEDPTIPQPPADPEIDSWVKDCTTTTNVQEPVTNLPATPTKTPAEIEENPITKTEEFVTAIVIELPDANINEDTTSQPSLDLEDNNDNVTAPTLQTTFQSNDFPSTDKVSTFFGEDNTKPESPKQLESEIPTSYENVVEEDNKIEEKLPNLEEITHEKKEEDKIPVVEEATKEENINDDEKTIPTTDESRTKDISEDNVDRIRIEEPRVTESKENPPSPTPTDTNENDTDKISEPVELNLDETENPKVVSKNEEKSETMEIEGTESVSNSHESPEDEPMDQEPPTELVTS